MTVWIIAAILILGFLMIFNLWAKSLLMSLAVIILTLFVLTTFTLTGNAYYWFWGAGLMILGSDLIFIFSKVERF
jgi:hypothetical protein